MSASPEALAQHIPILPKSLHMQPAEARRVRHVLVIDDDHDFAELMKFRLEKSGRFKVEIALDPFEAANALADHRYDLVVADCVLQDWDGVTTLENADHLIDVDPTVMDEWTNIDPVRVVFCSSAPVRLSELKRANRLKHFSVMGFLPKLSGLDPICRSVEQLATH
ncbi:MAG: response regulator [Bdellovibrionales bacterium]